MSSQENKRFLFWTSSIQKIFELLDSSEEGLSEQEARVRAQKHGLNEIKAKERRTGLEILLSQFTNSLVIILIIASIIAYFLGEKIESLVITSIVILNAIVGFLQEYHAERALRALKKYLINRANVMREGKLVTIDVKEIVPGDIVYLNIGDMIPADIRLIKSEELNTDESSLTGESLPVLKSSAPLEQDFHLPQDLNNIAFMGTSVAGGSGYGVVIGTGKDTFLGKTASYLKSTSEEGDLQKNIRIFSNFLLKIILAMTIFIFIVNTLLAKGVFNSLLFALALAVGLTPEALPIIITISLSRGAFKMAEQKVVTKKLASVEDFGNIDILCCDKTGTLTEGIISLSDYLSIDGNREGRLILYGLLCNSGQKGQDSKVFANTMDRAIWQSKPAENLKSEVEHFETIASNGFDFKRRRMSVMVRGSGKTMVIAKGAVESILSVSSSAFINGKVTPLNDEISEMIGEKISDYEQNGYRMLAIATKEITSLSDGMTDTGKEHLEKDLNIEGFLLFLDKAKKTVKESLKILQKLKVETKIISGDSPHITRKICNDVGLVIREDRVITGDDLNNLNEDKFKEYCRRYNIFTRVTPEQKFEIVSSLKKEGHIVGFLGDGINDAPALKAADVGISVNTASDIAKEAADIILLQKSLRVLSSGIREGRKTFANITKYILNTISANFGNMFTVAFSSLFLKFIPLLPSQILLNNFVSDAPLMTISTDNVDEEFLRRPRRWNIKLISKFMVYFGIISTFFDLALVLPLILILKVEPQVFRTAWFCESVLSELLITFSIRTRLLFFKSKPSKLLLFTSLIAVTIIIFLIDTSFGNEFFEFVRLPVNVILLIAGVLIAYFIAVEVVKRNFFQKFEL
ncbi:MAG: magnesium-translocating P-type ATPase [Atribacterota bacterium]|jgi:Mg2+-importing ATPase|nr:magnesium-translocating P-type ATPase [Atribacterota bacterium]